MGLLVSFMTSIVVNNISLEMFDIKVMNITPLYAFIGVGISIFVSTIAGLFPANKAAKLDPVDSLRSE